MENINKIQIVPDEVYEIGADKAPVIPEWSVKDDATLRKKVYDLAHSTFVRSKFLLEGTPNLIISNDGIASGFYASDGGSSVKPNTNKVTEWLSKPFEIIASVMSAEHTGSGLLGIDIDYATFCNYLKSSNQLVVALVDNTNTTVVAWQNRNIPRQLASHGNYLIKLKWDGTTYYWQISDDFGASWLSVYSKECSNPPKTSGWHFIKIRANKVVNYKSDLKCFKVISDGVEVFSGNKTGIDVIKPNDFNIYSKIFAYSDGSHTIYANSKTTPTKLFNADGSNYTGEDFTISENVVYYGETTCSYTSASDITLNTQCDAGVHISDTGIATNCNETNYIRTSFPTTSQNFDLYFNFTTGSDVTVYSDQWIRGVLGNYKGATSPTSCTFYFPINNTSTGRLGGINLYANSVYDFVLKRRGFDIRLEYSINGVAQTALTKTLPEEPSSTSTNQYVELGRWSHGEDIKIDLNKVKYYEYGEIKKQYMLRIPYTEAELNQKVVDVKYRDRVKDLFEQVGYNGYHTIDETNKNFTLPTHKFTDIIDHKEDADGTVAEQRVDMTVMAYGVAENGTDVNLPIEFADGTSYMVGGVTVSAKDADSFTPSSSGTWFARGKGKI